MELTFYLVGGKILPTDPHAFDNPHLHLFVIGSFDVEVFIFVETEEDWIANHKIARRVGLEKIGGVVSHIHHVFKTHVDIIVMSVCGVGIDVCVKNPANAVGVGDVVDTLCGVDRDVYQLPTVIRVLCLPRECRVGKEQEKHKEYVRGKFHGLITLKRYPIQSWSLFI